MAKKGSWYFEGYEAHYEIDERGRKKKVLTYVGQRYGLRNREDLFRVRVMAAVDVVLMTAILQNTLELLPDSDPVAFERLLELTDQGQFELIYPDDLKQGKIRLIYIMNDAAESFLAFEQARMKGKYKKDFEGEIEAELHLMKDQQEYGLIIRQAENVFTLFFRNLTVETRLYNYGEIGHFWISGYGRR